MFKFHDGQKLVINLLMDALFIERVLIEKLSLFSGLYIPLISFGSLPYAISSSGIEEVFLDDISDGLEKVGGFCKDFIQF